MVIHLHNRNKEGYEKYKAKVRDYELDYLEALREGDGDECMTILNVDSGTLEEHTNSEGVRLQGDIAVQTGKYIDWLDKMAEGCAWWAWRKE